MDFDEFANEITANAAHLHDEVTTLAELFAETAFLGNSRNLRYAHCGYLMTCMGQIDIMSLCMFGKGKGWGEQTRRMRDFIDQFLYEGKAEEHRVAVQLMRHTLMHTGDLRPVYDPPRKIAYTWQIFFGDAEEPEREHYSVTPEILAEQQEVIALANGRPVDEVRSFNLRLNRFSADICRAATKCTAAIRDDNERRDRCVEIFPTIRFQDIREPAEE